MLRVAVTLGLFAAVTPPTIGGVDLATREARLLAQVQAEGAGVAENLWELALVREQLGKYALAADTWGLLRQRHGELPAFGEGGVPHKTWGRVAEFWIARLQRKQGLARHALQPPSFEQRRAMGDALNDAGSVCYGPRDGQVDLLVQSDLDGDLPDELLVVGRYGPLGARQERFICLLRWADDSWQVFARWDESAIFMFPYRFEVGDGDGDGWKEIRTDFEPNTDNVGIIRCNGVGALWWF